MYEMHDNVVTNARTVADKSDRARFPHPTQFSDHRTPACNEAPPHTCPLYPINHQALPPITIRLFLFQSPNPWLLNYFTYPFSLLS